MENFKYYTLFGVRMDRGNNMDSILSRDFIMRWSTNEINAALFGIEMFNNEMFKTSKEEALHAVGLTQEGVSLAGIKIRMMHCSEITAHLFETDFVLEDDWIDILIGAANVSEDGKKQLIEAQIKI